MSSQPLTENTVTLFVTEIIGDRLCINCGGGKKLSDQIANILQQGKNVNLSFRDSEDITTAFLAEAFTHLYSNFPENKIETSLNVVDVQPDDAADIQCVIRDVKEYLNEPQRFTKAVEEMLGEDCL